MKKIVSLLVVTLLLVSCVMTAFAAELSPKTKEAVDAGLVVLDGSKGTTIITDPDAFEAKYGKISMLIVNDARAVPCRLTNWRWSSAGKPTPACALTGRPSRLTALRKRST